MTTSSTPSAPLRAVAIRCDGCGATFGVLPTPGQARCPYCQREHAISPQLLGQLQRYGASVQVELAQADAALDRAGAQLEFRRRGGSEAFRQYISAVVM